MSFTGRRDVNVSRYLRNLNQEPLVEEPTLITDDDLAEDLALFTNTQFYDFDSGQNTDFQAPSAKPKAVTRPQTAVSDDVSPTDSIMGDYSTGLDFINGDFSFGDFSSSYTSPTVPAFPDALGNLPIQPSPHPGYPASVSQQQSGSNRMLSFEDASRLAAEEDKRKRNTAASARFRIKKKQREQALEKSAKEMTDKVSALEGRISALETENKWLKSLVTEKHGGKDDIVKKLLEEFSAQKSTKGEESSAKGSNSSRSSSSGASTVATEDSDSRKSTKKRD
ncbi:hypothetical protein B0H63DRAFT_158960 [Podospora didyma]|uniref:BZIP domain-containing protein n=1 Tax=Podospora didyma TaxID=330526 RepID=A0AAE0NTP6_9PEZI|nr:hypothetical protein B0H63DRAFT_158960 [Podospora didyma]